MQLSHTYQKSDSYDCMICADNFRLHTDRIKPCAKLIRILEIGMYLQILQMKHIDICRYSFFQDSSFYPKYLRKFCSHFINSLLYR